MRSALIQSVRQALNQPLLSEARCEAVVRAVLEGIREPTGAMQADGRDVLLQYVDELKKPVSDQWQLARDTYRAMIDALTLSLGETE